MKKTKKSKPKDESLSDKLVKLLLDKGVPVVNSSVKQRSARVREEFREAAINALSDAGYVMKTSVYYENGSDVVAVAEPIAGKDVFLMQITRSANK